MDRRGLAALAVLAALALPAPAMAGLQNDVPSCYAANHIAPTTPSAYTNLIYVLIDQTVAWPKDLEASLIDNLNANLQPGTKFVIAEFSAFGQGRYLDVIHTGVIEAPMPAAQVANTPIALTRVFDACLADQRGFAVNLADASAAAALQNSTGSLRHSDIMAALAAVAAPIAADSARRKILLLASDGLENSGTASFYAHGAPRDIDPARELARAGAAGLFGQFSGARIYVIGGGLPPPAGTNGQAGDYEPPKLLADLARFWRLYFQHADADLVEFGEPALLQPVTF
jgi:hypothetical protein